VVAVVELVVEPLGQRVLEAVGLAAVITIQAKLPEQHLLVVVVVRVVEQERQKLVRQAVPASLFFAYPTQLQP
jgi:hypothetical protein